jgi:hypothetical protein
LGIAFGGVTLLLRPFLKLVYTVFDSANTVADLRFGECRLGECWDGAGYRNETEAKAAGNILLHFQTPM